MWRRVEVWAPSVLVAVFLVLLWLVAARPTVLTHFDSWVRDHVQQHAHSTKAGRGRWFWERAISDIGETVPALPGMGVVAAVAAAALRSWRPVLAALAAYAVLAGAVLAVKYAVGRPGPGQTTLVGDLGFFPSGHTANTMMCCGTSALIVAAALSRTRIARPARTVLAVGMVLTAAAVGASLVWLDYHWASDVLGSYALCGAALFGIARILRVDRADPSRGDAPAGPSEPLVLAESATPAGT